MTHERAAGLAAYDDVPATVLVGTRLLEAPGAGHMLPLERHELVTEELCRLIDRALVRPGEHVA